MSVEPGTAAIDGKIQQARPDILFLDLQLPKVDGFEVCRRIENDPSLREIDVIILTAMGNQDVHQNSLSAGVNRFLTKPCSTKELLSLLEQLHPNSPLELEFPAPI
jgi:two-component system, OmpR family, alkaline phosphatase synthesis response regulator PhoP